MGFEWVKDQLERIDHYSGKKWEGMDNVDPLRHPEDTKGPSPYQAEKESESAWE